MRSPKQSLDSREDDSGGINGSRWPRFADEDYIVFCFGEDGTFDVIKDGKGGASDHINCMTRESRSSSRPVNRKVSNKLCEFILTFDVFAKLKNRRKKKTSIHGFFLFNGKNSSIMARMKKEITAMAVRIVIHHMREIISSTTKR